MLYSFTDNHISNCVIWQSTKHYWIYKNVLPVLQIYCLEINLLLAMIRSDILRAVFSLNTDTQLSFCSSI